MPEIKLVKTLRRSLYNSSIVTGQSKGPRQWDYHAFIDGEFRAKIVRRINQSYAIEDAGGMRVCFDEHAPKHLGSEIADRIDLDVFKAKVQEALERGLLPTPSGIEARKAGKKLAEQEKRAAEINRAAELAVKDRAGDLFAAMRLLVVAHVHVKLPTEMVELVEQIEREVDKAKQAILDYHAERDAEEHKRAEDYARATAVLG